MRILLEGWGLAELYPDVVFSDSRLSPTGSRPRGSEPSWIGTVILGALALLFLVGAFVPQPRAAGDATRRRPRGRSPIPLAIYGELPTPRGPVRLRGAPAQLEWMNVEEVARTQWRYWGAGLGDVRGVTSRTPSGRMDRRRSGSSSTAGPGPSSGPSRPAPECDVRAGDAYLGPRRHPALGVRGDGAAATLTFADAASRDAAAGRAARVAALMPPRRFRLRRFGGGVQCRPCE